MEHVFDTPLTKDKVKELQIGDFVYLNGRIIGIRDATQNRIFNEGVEPPIDLKDEVMLHTAPNARKVGDKWEKICIGTTTSARMEKYSPQLIEKYGVSAIIGKGGLMEESLKAMQKYEAVYLAIVGGAAALETTQIDEIEAVYWEDLFPECMWVFKVSNFGPLIVGMDAYGNSIYETVSKEAKAKIPQLVESIVRG